MAGTTVDTDSLQRANAALQKYIGDVQYNINRLRSSAKDCSDNMGSDVYSQKAVQQLESSLKDMGQAIGEAEAVRQKIIRKIKGIEDSARNF